MDLEESRWPNTLENLPPSRLRKVLSDLIEASDIEGAILVEGKDSIIAYDLPDKTIDDTEIHKILAMLEESNDSPPIKNDNFIFTQSIFDYNGCKILAKRSGNLILLVMLQKQGYVGLAMLEIENSIRRIREILEGTYPNDFRLSG